MTNDPIPSSGEVDRADTEAISVVSLAGWLDGDPEARAAVAAAVDGSLRDAGFVVVVDHGVDVGLTTKVRAALNTFFALDEEAKSAYRVGVLGDTGWVPYGLEANGYVFGEDTPPDMKESLVFGMEDFPGHGETRANHWPSELPELRALVTEYFTQMERLNVEMLRLLGTALELDDPDLLVSLGDRAPSTFNANWYPPLVHTGEVERNQFRIGPHTDFGSITILDREPGVGCLQVQTADGSWVDAPFAPDSLTINVGDLLSMWTGGRWLSARHRVLPPDATAPDEALTSLVFFAQPNDDTLVAPLVEGDDFEPVLAADFIHAKIHEITVAV
jgi:isopenicillin N synthase-like dioxygenase